MKKSRPESIAQEIAAKRLAGLRAVTLGKGHSPNGVIEAAVALVNNGFSDRANATHGWELNGERAYLVDAASFDNLVAQIESKAQR